MRKYFIRPVVIALCLFLLFGCTHSPLFINSPDKNVNLTFALDESGSPYYQVSYRGKAILDRSYLSLELSDGTFSKGLKIIGSEKKSVDETYELAAGKSKKAQNHYNELQVALQSDGLPERRLDLVFRVFDDGAAYRYGIPEQIALTRFEILNEKSEFHFAQNASCWALELKSFTTNYESEFNEMTLGDIEPGSFIGLPLTVAYENGPFAAIAEANLTDYAGMYLDKSPEEDLTLVSKLSPLTDSSGVCVRGSLPHVSPWRVVMLGDEPGDLIESDIILNLNEPCAISDVSWIRPGKVAWPWWSGRMVSGVDFEGGMNTATQLHYIDFAEEFGLEYLLIDALWYGPHKDPAQDITRWVPEIDLPYIIEYAKDRGIGIVLWINWENTRDQMDRAFPLYEKWGVKGVKIDYMNRDDQDMVNYYHKVVKKAAEHHLLVDFHGAFKPTGIRRTYPNLITREGVLGLEHTKWSARVTPEHNVTLPFTRMLVGPMDYTPGAFQNVTKEEFKAQYRVPMAMGTRCHHLAMFAVYESPFQMCSDYPGSYRGQEGSEFLKTVPAAWDETRVIAGKIADYIAIARRYKDDWFIGAMTDWEPRSLSLALDFLGQGMYSATIYADGKDTGSNPRQVEITKKEVKATDTLTAGMGPGGGYIAHLKPVGDMKRRAH